MDFSLNEEQRMIRDMVRDFADSEIMPVTDKYEKNSEYPAEIIAKMGELGLMGMVVPEEYGSSAMDSVSYCLAIEEIARACPSCAVTMAVHNGVLCSPILNYGSDALKKKYLPPLASGEMTGGFALTEPNAGSDPSAMTAKAVRKGDSYILNGTKAWITNTHIGKIFIVMAVTDPSKGGKGISAFVVEAGTPGFRFGDPEDKMGLRCSKTSEIILEDCEVPAANILAEEGKGLTVALGSLDGGRIGIASQCVGIARGAFEEALSYSRNREQFGKPICAFQAIQFKLADMATGIHAARLLTHNAARMKDAGKKITKEGSMAKLYASEMANRVTADAVQIHGSYGFSKEYRVERLYRDARVTTIYEGTSEIQKIVISRELLKQ